MKIHLFSTGDDAAARAQIRDAAENAGLGPWLDREGVQIAFGTTALLADLPAGYIFDGGGYANLVEGRVADRPDCPPGSYANIDYEPADTTWERASRDYTELELLTMAQIFAQTRRKTGWKLALYGLPAPGPGWPTYLNGAALHRARQMFKACQPDWLMVLLYVTHSVYYGDRTEAHQVNRIREALRRFVSLRTPGMPAGEIIPYFQAFERGGITRPLHPVDARIWWREVAAAGVERVGWWIVGKTTDPEVPAKTVDGHIEALEGIAPEIIDVLTEAGV